MFTDSWLKFNMSLFTMHVATYIYSLISAFSIQGNQVPVACTDVSCEEWSRLHVCIHVTTCIVNKDISLNFKQECANTVKATVST